MYIYIYIYIFIYYIYIYIYIHIFTSLYIYLFKYFIKLYICICVWLTPSRRFNSVRCFNSIRATIPFRGHSPRRFQEALPRRFWNGARFPRFPGRGSELPGRASSLLHAQDLSSADIIFNRKELINHEINNIYKSII